MPPSTAAHEERGTMVCRLSAARSRLKRRWCGRKWVHSCASEFAPEISCWLRSPPVGLSARNIIPGRMVSLAQRDVIVVAKVNCGVEMEVHLTLAARESLHLQPGGEVWLVVKTHSCHLMGIS